MWIKTKNGYCDLSKFDKIKITEAADDNYTLYGVSVTANGNGVLTTVLMELTKQEADELNKSIADFLRVEDKLIDFKKGEANVD